MLHIGHLHMQNQYHQNWSLLCFSRQIYIVGDGKGGSNGRHKILQKLILPLSYYLNFKLSLTCIYNE